LSAVVPRGKPDVELRLTRLMSLVVAVAIPLAGAVPFLQEPAAHDYPYILAPIALAALAVRAVTYFVVFTITALRAARYLMAYAAALGMLVAVSASGFNGTLALVYLVSGFAASQVFLSARHLFAYYFANLALGTVLGFAADQPALSPSFLLGAVGVMATIQVFIKLAVLDVERSAAEHAVRSRASEALFDTTINAIGDGIHVVDREHRICYINRALLERKERLAYPTDLVGRTLEQAYPWLPAKVLAEYDAVFSRGEPIVSGDTVEVNGLQVVTQTHKWPVLQDEQVVRVVAVTRDVTELKRTEEALRQAKEVAERALEDVQGFARRLEASNRELQEFAYVASHDLQEPLRKIVTFGSRLQERSRDSLDDTARDYLARMQGAASRMQALIEALLQYSRVTSKSEAYQPLELEAVVREVLSDLEVAVETSGVQVDVGPLPRVLASPVQMRQLFQNLIGNALKFRRPDVPPRISVSSARVDEPAVEEDSQVNERRFWEVTVADNGIGFDQKYAERIFGVFQRLHPRQEYAGTGVGLAICRKIVEKHGGSITAHGVPEQGATFRVRLPAAPG
jgi:PAS domain S-box-containing protein